MLKSIPVLWKLSAVVIVIILLLIAALGYRNNRTDEQRAVSLARETSFSCARIVSDNIVTPPVAHDFNRTQDLVRMLGGSNPDCTNMRLLAHTSGNIMAEAHPGDTASLSRDHPLCLRCHDSEGPPEEPAVQAHDEILELSDGRRLVAVTIPILNETGCRDADCHVHAGDPPVLGFLEADYSLDRVDNIISSRNTRTLIGILIAVVLSVVTLWFLVGFYVKRPVRALTTGMNELAERKFDFRLAEDEKDEFGSLASSFNDMASILSSSLRELEKTRDYIRGILESSADIIITVNSSGLIRTFNTGAENVLGYLRTDVIGESIEMLFADPDERKVAAEKLKYSDDIVNYATRFRTKEGDLRDVLLTISQLRNPRGELIGTIGIGKDMTEEKRLQNLLMESQRFAAIGQVFTGIQHSMKNMLNACKGGAYMVDLGLRKENQDMLVEGWQMVKQGISRMADMSKDMLRYAKDSKPRLVRTDLAQMLSDIEAVIKQTAKDKGVEFKLDIAPELPTLSCDSRMIHSAVMDIVSNALDACLWKETIDHEAPKVVVSARPSEDGKEICIEVTDNGCGMTKEVKENIFTPFFSTKSKTGTGLGLSIASRMIAVHVGKIDVESEPNRGTTFRILLPIDGTGGNKEDIDAKEGSGS
ncbi:MAG: PAS domain S-box protein [Candidatus Zixiibacteriota bacterium]|nr:MAG: PAS domain S-box protein [candidate division Zixibacteria bacterium]